MKIRVRADLEFYPVEGYRHSEWVVRDPLTMTCYQLGAEEHFLLTQFQQADSLEDLRMQFEKQFAPRKLSSEELQNLLADWLSKRLLLGDPRLLARWEKNTRPAETPQQSGFWQNVLRNPLAIRFRGWNPQYFLEALTPWFGWIYTWEFAACSLLLGLSALGVAVHRSAAIVNDLQDLPLLFGPEQWLIVAVCISIAKILHEFGHGITCHHYGGRCHEMGVILLVGIPCLYCNVTDAWTFPRRSQRIAVSAAGIVVDLWLASLCLLLWHFSQPGLFHSICLLLAVLGSVNSLLLNGNPLMRYDGYYLCSDYTGIANLRSQAMQQTRSLFWRAMMGKKRDEHNAPIHPVLLSYGLLSGVYLWLIVVFILVGIYHWLKPWGMEAVAVLAGMILIPAQLVGTGSRLYREGEQEFDQRGNPTRRLQLGMLLTLALLLVIFFTPFPRRAPALGVLRAVPAQAVVCLESGQIEKVMTAGHLLKEGEIVYQLSHPELTLELARLETQLAALSAQEDAIARKRTQLADSSEALSMIAENRAALEDQKERLSVRLQAMQSTAAISGTFIPDPFRFQPAEEGNPPVRNLDPLAPENRGMLLQTGDVLGRISPRTAFQVIVSIEAHWADQMVPASTVMVFLPETGGKSHSGRLLQLSSSAEQLSPSGNLESAQKILQQAIQQVPGSADRSYVTGIVELDTSGPDHWSDYQRCHVRIDIPPASLWQRLTEFLQRTWKQNSL